MRSVLGGVSVRFSKASLSWCSIYINPGGPKCRLAGGGGKRRALPIPGRAGAVAPQVSLHEGVH